MKPFTALAFAGLAAAQLPSFADSINVVDTFMRDLHISFHELTTSHPRRSFHRRQSGQLAKRCIPRPANYPGPGGNGTTTTRSASGSTSRTARPTTTRSAPASTTTSRVTSLLISTSSTTTSTTSTTVVFPTIVFPTRTSFTTTSTTSTTTSTTSTTPTSTSTTSTTSTTPTTTSTSTSSTSTSTSSPSTTALPSPTPSSSWNLQTTMEGNNFFDAWQFWAYPDPTNGAVDYQTIEGSEAAGLHEINSEGHAIMRVETTPKVTGNRKSVRIHSNIVINGGLVIIDAVHMPYGCGTWPAFWSNGPNWPDGGEIDIIEGVNGYERNQASLHTKTGCTIPENYGSSATLAASVNCAAYETGNQGCGQLGSKPNNYGKSFNDNGGGVYAMKWDTSGISIYFFPREDIPSDIIDEKPQPDKWGTPSGNWPAQNCDPYQFFKDHILIFDTTLCGDWAGNAWHSSGIAGQSQTCAQSTGYDTCLDYIRNEGGAFKDAFWQVKSIKVYT